MIVLLTNNSLLLYSFSLFIMIVLITNSHFSVNSDLSNLSFVGLLSSQEWRDLLVGHLVNLEIKRVCTYGFIMSLTILLVIFRTYVLIDVKKTTPITTSIFLRLLPGRVSYPPCCHFIVKLDKNLDAV